jgi:DNA repair exonuclease SbcCD nuclease subunit
MHGIQKRGIKFTGLAGNHDVTYKNTNIVNAWHELYGESAYPYDIIIGPEERVFDGLPVLMLPWINAENAEQSFKMMADTRAQIAMGHLEIKGFEMFRGQVSDHGLEGKVFDKFDMVFSGHYHHRSTNGNIFYLGAPYEMTWSDYGDPKGFHIFDTATRNLDFIRNPYIIHKKFQYDDTELTIEDLKALDYSDFANHYVKVMIKQKTNPYIYDTFIGLLENSGVYNFQAIDETLLAAEGIDDDIIDQAEDTMTILRKYIESLNFKDQKELVAYFQTLYTEAISIE